MQGAKLISDIIQHIFRGGTAISTRSLFGKIAFSFSPLIIANSALRARQCEWGVGPFAAYRKHANTLFHAGNGL